MEIKELDKQISSGNIKNAYFFYGDEQFLLENKINSIKNRLIDKDFAEFNYVVFDGKKTPVDDILDALRSVPVMSDKKMVVVKNCGIFDNSKLKSYISIKEELKNLPEYMCVIFTERAFDKKKEKNIDIFSSLGGIVKFDYLPPKQLELWLEKMFENAGKSILSSDITAMLERSGQSMASAYNEYNKLINFLGDRKKITKTDIEAVVTKSVEARIFDMIDNIAENRKTKIFEELRALRDAGETSSTIMALINGRLSELLMVKDLLEDKLSVQQISGYFEPKKPDFVVKKLISQSRKFDSHYLHHMTLKGLEYTCFVRSGELDQWLAVEMYVAELCNPKI